MKRNHNRNAKRRAGRLGPKQHVIKKSLTARVESLEKAVDYHEILPRVRALEAEFWRLRDRVDEFAAWANRTEYMLRPDVSRQRIALTCDSPPGAKK